MAPRTEDVICKVPLPPTNSSLKVISLALSLPLVSDTVTAASSLAGPYMQAVGPYVGPVVESCSPLVVDIGARAGEVLSDNVKAKVTGSVSYLDSLACSGLDKLTEALPCLKQPELLAETKDTMLSRLGLFSDYLASFQCSQFLLSLCDKGLQAVETVVQVPIIKSLRRTVRATKRAGSKRAGPARPVAGIGEASLLGALAEIFGANFFLSIIGLELVPVQKVSKKVVSGGTVKPSSKSGLSRKFEDLNLIDYVSDQDADYTPSEESSHGSIEYDSEVEDNLEDAETVYEDEHAKVIEGDSSAGDEEIINAEDYECDPIECEQEAKEDFEELVAVEKVEAVYFAESDEAEYVQVEDDYSEDVGAGYFQGDFSTNVETLRDRAGTFTEDAGFECLDKYFSGEADAVSFSENAVDESFAEHVVEHLGFECLDAVSTDAVSFSENAVNESFAEHVEHAGLECLDAVSPDAVYFSENAVEKSFTEHVESEYLDGDFFENVEDVYFTEKAEAEQLDFAEYLE